MSFATIGALWLAHNAITDYLDRADVTLLRLNLLLLLLIAFLPFPTRLVAEYVHATTHAAERVAVTVYGVTLLIAAAVLLLFWRYALRARLVRPDARDEEITLLTHRLTPGLAGYVLLIIIGLFSPVTAVIGYLVIALFFLIPFRIRRREPARS